MVLVYVLILGFIGNFFVLCARKFALSITIASDDFSILFSLLGSPHYCRGVDPDDHWLQWRILVGIKICIADHSNMRHSRDWFRPLRHSIQWSVPVLDAWSHGDGADSPLLFVFAKI